MRILMPVHVFYPGHRAGVEAYTLQLAQELGREHEVRVLCTEKVLSRPLGSRREYEHEGVAVTEVANPLIYEDYADTWRAPAMARAFGEELARFRPDVVHAQHMMYWSNELPRIAHALDTPFVLTLHDYFLACGRMGQLVDADGRMCPGPAPERCAPCLARTSWRQTGQAERWIRRLRAIRRLTGIALDRPLRALQRRFAPHATRTTPPPLGPEVQGEWRARFAERTHAFHALGDDVDLFVTPSETLREFLVEWGLPPGKVRHIPQGLDGAPFAGARPKKPETPLRLAFLGTIAPHKGLHVLLEAVARLRPEDVTLTIYGPAVQHRGYLAELKQRFGALHHVRFAGALERGDVPLAYEDIDLLCVPSLWNECCPLTIQEAFMARVPSVVSGIGGMAELVRDGLDGRHAEPGDVDDWERVLRELAAAPSAVAEMARATPAVPTLAEHRAQLEGIYAELNARRARRGLRPSDLGGMAAERAGG